MAMFDFFDTAASEGCERSITARRRVRLAATSAIALAGLLAPSAAMAEVCQFEPRTDLQILGGLEPRLIIDGTCEDPDYNEDTFVITNVEELSFQVPDGPLIPYTQVTGHFPAMATPETLPPGVRLSPLTHQQNYVWRFPAAEVWQNRSMQVQHPLGSSPLDNRFAFTNGAFSMNWLSGNPVYTHRHHAAATKLAKAYANELYGNGDKIYSYYWGCSGGGVVAQAATENSTGVWDGVQVQCTAPAAASHHAFHWRSHYVLAVPAEKRAAVAAAAEAGLDIYAGLNEEEESVLNELLFAGYPVATLGSGFGFSLNPLINPGQIRATDPTYEDDFWSEPGYAGTDPPNYLTAALVDGFATITGITTDAAGVPTAIEFDPATVPALGSIGDTNLNYYVFAADGTTRTIDPTPANDAATLGSVLTNARFTLSGDLDTITSTLTLTGTNNPLLLDALEVGGKIRINNRFILSIYFYPRYSIQSGFASYNQYLNPDGSPKHPQRTIDFVGSGQAQTMGGRVETGNINSKTMIFANMGDNLSWPLFNAGYALLVEDALGPAEAKKMMRVYIQDNGGHSSGGLVAGVFRQSIIDLMAWAEHGIKPKASSRFAISDGQVILEPEAGARKGLQPVINFTGNGSAFPVVGVNQPVDLVATFQMPPNTGKITQYHWAIDGDEEAATILAKPSPGKVKITRTLTFETPGTYVVRLNVTGQRDGIVEPFDRTLKENFQDVRVVVE